MRVMIVVTHLLGTGHLARALTLAWAYQAAGHSVEVVSGGMPAPLLDRGDVPLMQLPPLRSDGVNFARLLTDNDKVADAAFHTRRQAALLAALDRSKPDLLITELFPFGRRILQDEFKALLGTATAQPQKPLICASIRDILAPPSKPKKAALADWYIDQFYDAVLVHSDPDIAPLETSWPVSDTLLPKLRYTGFVAAPNTEGHPQRLGQDEIIVSSGGSDVGTHVYRAALAAAQQSADLNWRFLIGGAHADVLVAELADNAPGNVLIEKARPDFRQMLHHAKASVSLCGYNTALDILQAGTAAVFVPFDAGDEVEQGLRAKALAQLDGIVVVKAAALTGETLLNAVRHVTHAPSRSPRTTGFSGAQETVKITENMRGQA